MNAVSEECGAESFLIRSRAARPLPQTSETNRQSRRATLGSCVRRPRTDTKAEIISCRSWGHMMAVSGVRFFFFKCFNHKAIYKITLDPKGKQSARKKFQLYFKRENGEKKNYTSVF